MSPVIGQENRRLYEFGALRLDPVERVLARNGERIALAPKAFDTLLLLVQHGGHVLSKEELIKTLWPDSFVEENNLAQYISLLRRALEDGAEGGEYIETVPKVGYRFVAAVRELIPGNGNGSAIPGAKAPMLMEQTRGLKPPPPDRVDQQSRIQDAETSPRRTQSTQSGRRAAAIAFSAVVVVAAATAAWELLGHRAAGALASGALVRLTSDPGLTMTPALSPDGKLIAYASDRGGKGNLNIWAQPAGGGTAIQLTDGGTDNYGPSFSADGRTVAFRSERDGGGIYIVSADGGEARLIASRGRRPKYSPDGKWIAYWEGTEAGDNTGSFLVPGAGKTYVIAASGGTPREIHPEFAASGYPVWAPDGKHLLFLGNRDANEFRDSTMDWWVTDLESGEAVRTGAGAEFKEMRFASASQAPEAWTADNGVLTSATLSDTRNIWKVPISTKTWKISGAPERLTSGTSMDLQPSVAGGQMVFSSVSGNLDVWSLPINANRAEKTGDLQQLTSNAVAHAYPAISPDGTKLAYSLQRGGSREIWVRDLKSAQENAISASIGPSFNPNFSPDGNELLYRAAERQTSVGYAVSLSAGGSKAICEDCSDYGWSSDKTKLVLVGTTPVRISILDLATRRRTGLLNHPVYLLWNARFSPDDRWVSFNATAQGRSQVFVAPVRETAIIPEREWIPIAESGWDDKPRWSPDGSTLYFVSERDGFRCVWAQRLDSRKHPVGEAIPVFHAHESRRSLSNVGPGDLGISVARDKIVFNMSERTGNLWMTRLVSGR